MKSATTKMRFSPGYYAEFNGVVLYQTSSLAILKNKALVAFGQLGENQISF